MADGDKNCERKTWRRGEGYKVGPLPVFKWSYGAPINGFINGQVGLQPYFWIFLPPFVTGRGPPCTNHFG